MEKITTIAGGDEIVQAYLGAPEAPGHVQKVKKQLAGFLRVEDILPGESRRITIPITERELSYWDILAPITECADGTKGKWILSKGGREVMVGSASDRILYSKTVNL
ncbi:MAG: fibronectin type III-like domain-contianing protein [Oscillospiraceae bacterium]|nr:fibronectin type III-like domain-contianing protein [Oscillospiraceae bacterium]